MARLCVLFECSLHATFRLVTADFEVTTPLPNVTFPLTRSFAGNIGVNRADHPNDMLFFWVFESENGSLTRDESNRPWAVWLNGGPGWSSMLGLLTENGPLLMQMDESIVTNPYAWSKLVDYVWVDQPV